MLLNLFQMHCSGMLWHPDVATQLVLASEDDRMPVIQMWDLRFATSPLKVFENHTRSGFKWFVLLSDCFVVLQNIPNVLSFGVFL